MDSPRSPVEAMSARPANPPPAPLASPLTGPAQTQSRPIPDASEMQMSSPPPVVDLTVFADMRTTNRGRGNELAPDQATSLRSIAASIEFASAGSSGHRARGRSGTPNASQASSPTPSSGSRGRSAAARSTRGRPIGRTARDPAHEAELAAKRARYVPRSRGTPKTAMSLNPDYVAYSHLEQRPWGMEGFEKDEFDRLIIRKSELFCRVGDEDTGELCHEIKRFSGSEAVSGHVKSGKHRLPVGPRGFQGNIAAERADNAKFYKDFMARQRELGGPEPVYPDAGQQNVAAEDPRAYSPAAGDYLPDAPGMMPTYFPGADPRATARAPPVESSAAADFRYQRGRPMTAQEHAAAVAALPTVAFEAIPKVPVVHGGKRKRTEAERELKRTKKELTIANQLRAEVEAELEQLRQEKDDLFNELKLIKPDFERRKIGRGDLEEGVKIKTEEKIEIKRENMDEGQNANISDADRALIAPVAPKEGITDSSKDQITQQNVPCQVQQALPTEINNCAHKGNEKEDGGQRAAQDQGVSSIRGEVPLGQQDTANSQTGSGNITEDMSLQEGGIHAKHSDGTSLKVKQEPDRSIFQLSRNWDMW